MTESAPPYVRPRLLDFPPAHVEAAARAAHEANRAWCIAHGDLSQKGWDEAPSWQRESCRLGVVGVIEGNTSRQSHEGWLAHKAAEGWTYGTVKDEVAKRHPCMVDYDDLPPEQRRKDGIFVAVVRAVLGMEETP